HAVLIGFITDIRNSFDFLFLDQLGNTLLQGFFVYLVWQCIYDNRLASVIHVFEVGIRTHDYATTTSPVPFTDSGHAINSAPSWKVRSRNIFEKLVYCAIGILKAIQTTINYLT